MKCVSTSTCDFFIKISSGLRLIINSMFDTLFNVLDNSRFQAFNIRRSNGTIKCFTRVVSRFFGSLTTNIDYIRSRRVRTNVRGITSRVRVTSRVQCKNSSFHLFRRRGLSALVVVPGCIISVYLYLVKVRHYTAVLPRPGNEDRIQAHGSLQCGHVGS